jgi:hypothetical protein
MIVVVKRRKVETKVLTFLSTNRVAITFLFTTEKQNDGRKASGNCPVEPTSIVGTQQSRLELT